MKRYLILVGALLALARAASAQPSLGYTNNGTVSFTVAQGAPQIDAYNFVNNGEFSLLFNTFTGGGSIDLNAFGVLFVDTALPPYSFSDVTNFVNRGSMVCDTGFRFDTEPSNIGVTHAAASFTNSNLGSITVGSLNSTALSDFVFFAGPGFAFNTGVPYLQISATNLSSQGTLTGGLNSYLGISGGDVDLSRGTLHIQGYDDTNILENGLNVGIFDAEWGLGLQTNRLSRFNLTPPNINSPIYTFTNIYNVTGLDALPDFQPGVAQPSFEAFVNTNFVNQSNITYQLVFVNNNLPGVSVDVRFPQIVFPAGIPDFAVPVIQWTAPVTNSTVIKPITNFLYALDLFGAQTNFAMVTNTYTLAGFPRPAPFNYQFARSLDGFIPQGEEFFGDFDQLPPGNTTYDTTTETNILKSAFGATNQYSDYTVNILPVTATPDPDLTGSTVTNSPGDVVITATGSLDLTDSSISGANYLSIRSTNHFVGSSGAAISAPYIDYNLGYTNPNAMVITNLVAPFIARLDGSVQMYSARWTNTVMGVTNSYHVWMVYANLTPVSTPTVENFILSPTNLVTHRRGDVLISDAITISNRLKISAQSLTLTTNAPGAAVPYGQLTVATYGLSAATLPGVIYLTNWGQIVSQNVLDNFTNFVNHGSSSSSGFGVAADYFESTGIGVATTNLYYTGTIKNAAVISSTNGPISIQAPTVILSRGALAAVSTSGDITINAGNLTLSNETVQASGALLINVTNQLNPSPDGSGAYWPNSFTANDGFSALVKPAIGDLLGTTIDDLCPSGAQIRHTWAGIDLGPDAAGFNNNLAVGHLILDGNGNNCSFFFTGVSVSNAIYVDEIDLRDNATNIVTASQGFTALSIDSNMRIYFADAVINGGALDVSQRLDGQYGGRIRWVRNFAGQFGGTNITYPNGLTYTFNRALVDSTTIDSNGNGIVNAYDPFPINVNPSVTVSNMIATISWEAASSSTNYVYYSTSLSTTNWTLLTSIPAGPVSSQVSVTDAVGANHARFYKIQIAQ